jgi:DNA-binding NarL/FixJ family response regulator
VISTVDAGIAAEQAWRDGDTATAIETADRVLASGTDPECRAAGVAAAATTADGALFDAAHRWRQIATALGGVPGSWAGGRAALAACLAGDATTAQQDLADSHALLPVAAPRGLTVLFDGIAATLQAIDGGLDHAARRLAGLAVASVPSDPLAPQRWDDLAVTVMIAAGDDATARETLTAYRDRPQSTRRQLLAAWLDLRAGRLSDARNALATAGEVPVMRRDAVLAAAVTVGLARRTGDDDKLRSTWHRVAPVLHGADIELFLLEAWGELATAAALISPTDHDQITSALAETVSRAGAPAWAAAAQAWWALQQAIATDDPTAATDAARQLTGRDARATAAQAWAAVLNDTADPATVAGAAQDLADAGQPWEAAALCAAAAARLGNVELLGTARAIRSRVATTEAAAGGLSTRESAVGKLLIDGLTQKEIGARLYISPKTVEQHVARLRQKLEAANRAELIAALRTRLAS